MTTTATATTIETLKERMQRWLDYAVITVNGKGPAISGDLFSGSNPACVYTKEGHPGCFVGCQKEFGPFRARRVSGSVRAVFENHLDIEEAFLRGLGESEKTAARKYLYALQGLHDVGTWNDGYLSPVEILHFVREHPGLVVVPPGTWMGETLRERKQRWFDHFLNTVDGKGRSARELKKEEVPRGTESLASRCEPTVCVYTKEGHPGCAVGCQEEFEWLRLYWNETAHGCSSGNPFWALVEWPLVKTAFGLGLSGDDWGRAIQFLSDLQRLHDAKTHWDGLHLVKKYVHEFAKRQELTCPAKYRE